ncbi:hypothetical protein CVT26_001338 [Gymnopilus dilepis]|uniref:Uncharacterized protein n=1 Tax=Gymnopilus dilepis TaxID=231916 RepID=A0A409YUS8_9AGAR|nr:hypothetical protein CVT26_001338 [Gymnopilus dilepis]
MSTIGNGVLSPTVPHFEMTEWVTKAITIVAIVIQVMEFFYQFIDEVEYIWRLRVRLITYLYAWSRYLALVVQVLNFILSEMLVYSPEQNTCWRVYVLRSVTVQLSTTCLEAILMTRVYALYNCSFRSRLILAGAFTAGAILEFTGSIIAVTHIEPGPGGDWCSPEPSTPLALSLFASGVGVIQITVLVMTASQYFFTRKAGRIVRTPMVSLMLRDEISIFLLLSVVFASVSIFEILRGYMTFSVEDGSLIWNASYAWYISLTSIAGCRMILTLRRLAYQHLKSRLPDNYTGMTYLAEFSTGLYSDDEE